MKKTKAQLLDEIRELRRKVANLEPECKHAEETVKESEKKYQDLVEHLHAGVVIHAPDTRIIFSNPAARVFLALSEEQLLGKTAVDPNWTFIHANGQIMPLCDYPVNQVAATRKPLRNFVIGVRRSQKQDVVWGLVHAFPVFDAQHALQQIVVTVIDITERKQAEEILVKERTLLRTLIDNLPDHIYIKDTDSRFLIANTAVARTVGLTRPEELVGKTDFDVSSREFAERYYADEQRIMATGQPLINREEPNRNPDTGATCWFLTTKIPFRDNCGNIIGVLGIAHDITERKQLEEELRKHREHLEELVDTRTAELKEANTELSQYAYVVSHDLRTPLRAIQNYARFLREDLEDVVQDEQKTYLDGLDRAIQEAEALIENLLNLSRIDRRNTDSQRINTGTFLREIVSAMNLPEEVEIVMQADWPVLDTQPVLLRQIFQNLIGNAVQYNKSSHKRVELGWRLIKDDRYEYCVRDNGIGIAPECHEKIFRIFERLHTREEFEGTGIGLALVKKAVAKLGGSVRVESLPDQGSAFFVTLPKILK